MVVHTNIRDFFLRLCVMQKVIQFLYFFFLCLLLVSAIGRACKCLSRMFDRSLLNGFDQLESVCLEHVLLI